MVLQSVTTRSSDSAEKWFIYLDYIESIGTVWVSRCGQGGEHDRQKGIFGAGHPNQVHHPGPPTGRLGRDGADSRGGAFHEGSSDRQGEDGQPGESEAGGPHRGVQAQYSDGAVGG